MSPHEDDLRKLETELRSSRPEPRPAFLAQMRAEVADAQRAAPRARAPRFRLAFAGAVIAAFAIPLVAFGGIRYATDSVADSTRSVSKAFSAAPKPSQAPAPAVVAKTSIPQATAPKVAGPTAEQESAPALSPLVAPVSSLALAAVEEYPSYWLFCVELDGVGFVNMALPITPNPPYSVSYWLANPLGWLSISQYPCGFPGSLS